MFRRLLTYHLILAVAVGPLFCCCTPGRLVATPSTPAAPSPTSQLAPPSSRITSPCCAHRHQAAKPNPDRDHSDHKPAPSKPGGKCPCKEGSGKSATISTGATAVDVSTLVRTASLDLDTSFSVVDCNCHPTLERSAARGSCASLLSTADLLFSHHKLRC